MNALAPAAAPGSTRPGHRICVVTGSASGIGAAVAGAFAGAGERVIGIDVREADVIADLSTTYGRQSAVEAVRAISPVVDVVVTSAGLARANAAALSVNYFGTVDVLTGVLPMLHASAAPRVVCFGSVAAVHPAIPALVDACLDGDEDHARAVAEGVISAGNGSQIYASSKQALSRWVRRTAVTAPWAGRRVTLNAVGPGVVVTPMVEKAWSTPEGRARLLADVPMPLGGQPVEVDQIVRAVTFLASPENRSVTGQVLYVDAGADAAIRGDDRW